MRLAEVLPLLGGAHWVDLGTGGGLPGLVLAIERPDVHFTLLDSVRKKTASVEEFAQRVGLDNVTVMTGRAEVLAHETAHRGCYDGVVSRAVGPMAVVLELSRGFVSDGGYVVTVKGPSVEAELERGRRARHVLGLGHPQVEGVAGTIRPTFVATMTARGRPPRGYPRATGVPKRRPLGMTAERDHTADGEVMGG